ncbi:peptidoglycan editing factor PgeF [Sphingopyxis sp. DHUNG17]|uniref:peptidoglycan editing factor PgeF n=1 Tax=Sphingopyxis jiangsuensis TaxID=2871171 RepID=UPI00191E21E0|nr:peptidoglycan editing factor PgeF [Sphingopyxis lutea]MBL0768845.1 peptidoglycan editing factor PgeF [Sphingopyxis lutea]
MTPPFATAAPLAGVPHGFFGRQGGVSTGELASLNCGLGSGDDPALIAENRRRAADAVLPGAALTGLYQVHGARCVIVDAASDLAARPEADALATRTPGILLAILTADCVPVLFADAEAGVVGAAHAGWKGALAGVTDRTLATMESLGARRDHIAAAIGPCIGRGSYEVDMVFVDRFCADDAANEHFFAAGRPGHAMFDIAAYVAARLAAAGVGRIDIGGQDTCAEEADYFSYRRACLRGEGGYGRQISIIGIANQAAQDH